LNNFYKVRVFAWEGELLRKATADSGIKAIPKGGDFVDI
jgi:hypothetical protein